MVENLSFVISQNDYNERILELILGMSIFIIFLEIIIFLLITKLYK